MNRHPLLHLVEHPLTSHLLDEARDRDTPTPRFRQIVRTLGTLLAFEATRDLQTRLSPILTPLEPMQATRLAGPITAVPVLRAGLGLAEGMQDLIPDLRVGHLGMFRDEDRLEPVSYYRRLPTDISAGPVLVVDPMLATGGSAEAAILLLKEHGCRDLRFVCLLAAPEGLSRLAERCADVPVYAAAVDRELNERGYILPGLGDAGDRLYGTLA